MNVSALLIVNNCHLRHYSWRWREEKKKLAQRWVTRPCILYAHRSYFGALQHYFHYNNLANHFKVAIILSVNGIWKRIVRILIIKSMENELVSANLFHFHQYRFGRTNSPFSEPNDTLQTWRFSTNISTQPKKSAPLKHQQIVWASSFIGTAHFESHLKIPWIHG